MKAFAELFAALDGTTRTNAKVAALADYFRTAAPEDAAWAMAFLAGRKPKRPISSTKLRTWAAEAAGIPDWLFEECYDSVGDLAETVALLLPCAPKFSGIPTPHPSKPSVSPTSPTRGEVEEKSIHSSTSPRVGEVGEQSEPGGGCNHPLTHPLLPKPVETVEFGSLSKWVTERLLPLRSMAEAEQKSLILKAWSELDTGSAFVWNKLITGAFRVGVSQQLVVRAIALVSSVPVEVLAHRLMGDWQPDGDFVRKLLTPDSAEADRSKPYPFFLAHPIEGDPAQLGEAADWHAEWKWDGIRAQLMRRGSSTFVWTRGEELVTERYPELAAVAEALPDGTVLDGELLPWQGDAPLPFALLQKRIGRKTIGAKLLAEVPVVLVAYDLLEAEGRDLRPLALRERRVQLEALVSQVADSRLRISPAVPFSSWADLAALRRSSRARRVEGLMLKRLDSPYRVGRTRGDWWKWKVEPYAIDAVLTAAQKGHGKRANLFTDYTFGVWDGGKLITVAKAYSGLTDAEITEVDEFIRKNTLEKFGPVRTVKPELVFELGFEGLQLSSRHKSGIAVRFPRMLRWRTDKPAAEADTLDTVKALLRAEGDA